MSVEKKKGEKETMDDEVLELTKKSTIYDFHFLPEVLQ